MTSSEENQIPPVKSGEALMVGAFLSVPLLGTPLMLAICAEFLRAALPRSRSRVSDLLFLLGHVIAYHLALTLLLRTCTAESALLWCAVALPISYSFCRFALVPKK